MKILIIGGLGYIGGRLSNHLLREHPQVQLFLTTRRKNVPAWSQSMSLFQMDLADRRSIEQAVATCCPEIVIHLGALPQDVCTDQPAQACTINANGTAQLLNVCSEYAIKHFVYLSTSQVYGSVKGSISESTVVHPENTYAQTKYEGEKAVCAWSSRFKIQSTILRLSNSYGCPADHGASKSVRSLVFNAFCQEAVLSRQIKIKSNQYRNFIPMEDVVRSIDFLAIKKNSKEIYEIFNVGSQECLSVKQAAERVRAIYQEMYPGHPVDIVMPSSETSAKRCVPFEYNIERLLRSGFQPRNNFKNEIVNTLKFFQEEERARG